MSFLSELLGQFWGGGRSGGQTGGGGGQIGPAPAYAGLPVNLDSAISAQYDKGLELEGEENRRYKDAMAQLTGNFDRLHQPTLTDTDIQNLYSKETDKALQGELADMGQLRSALGSAGITGGGTAAAMAARINTDRFKAIKGAKRDMRITRALSATEDRAREMQDRMSLAQFQMASPSMIGLDTLTNISDLRFGEKGLEAGKEIAQINADATRAASRDSKNASIAGGVLGLVGSLLPF